MAAPDLTALPLAAWERDGLQAALARSGLPTADLGEADRLFWRFETTEDVPVGFGGIVPTLRKPRRVGQPKLGGPAPYPQRLKPRLIEFGFTSRLKAATFQIQSHLHLQIQSHPHLQCLRLRLLRRRNASVAPCAGSATAQ